MDSQRLVSAHLVPFAARIDDRLAERWSERAETYSVIQRQLREIGGRARKGRPAAAEGANAVARLRPSRTTPSSSRASSPASNCSSTGSTTASPTSSKTGSSAAPLQRVTLPRLVDGAGNWSGRSANASYPSAPATELESSALSASACAQGSGANAHPGIDARGQTALRPVPPYPSPDHGQEPRTSEHPSSADAPEDRRTSLRRDGPAPVRQGQRCP